MNFQVNDLVLFSFKLVQIREMTDNRIREVSDGCLVTSGYDLSEDIFPLTLWNYQVSQSFERQYKILHEKGKSQLNFPDFFRHFVSTWRLALQNPDKVKDYFNKIKTFTEVVLLLQNETEQHQVQNVNVFYVNLFI